jgi:hypothetical protein
LGSTICHARCASWHSASSGEQRTPTLNPLDERVFRQFNAPHHSVRAFGADDAEHSVVGEESRKVRFSVSGYTEVRGDGSATYYREQFIADTSHAAYRTWDSWK